MTAYIAHFVKDKKLYPIIRQHGLIQLTKQRPVHLMLIRSILSQQLSVKVANTLRTRFYLLFETQNPSPDEIILLPFEVLRSIGLSRTKTEYILNVADFFNREHNVPRKLSMMSNEEVIDYLTQIKGVGRWTVEMLLMFTLAREDVFPVDDYGIQTAMKRLYKLQDTNKKQLRKSLSEIAAKWHPYETYACMHLWRWKDEQ